MNFSANNEVRKVKAGATAATTEVVSDTIDMQGAEGVILFTTIATANAGNYLKAQSSDAANMANAVDLEGKKIVAVANGQVVWLDIYKPQQRYITANVIRGASTAVGDIYAIKYGMRTYPVDNLVDSALIGELLVSPAQKAIS